MVRRYTVQVDIVLDCRVQLHALVVERFGELAVELSRYRDLAGTRAVPSAELALRRFQGRVDDRWPLRAAGERHLNQSVRQQIHRVTLFAALLLLAAPVLSAEPVAELVRPGQRVVGLGF